MLTQLNSRLFLAVNNLAGHNVFWDKIGIVCAQYMPLVFVLALIYLWWRGRRRRQIAWLAGLAAALGLGLNFFIALFYFHPRPFVRHLGRQLIQHAPDASFPSDHTTAMLAIAFTFLLFPRTRVLGFILTVLGFIGGLSRVYVGVHYPFDIVGSAVVAAGAAGLIFLSARKFKKQK